MITFTIDDSYISQIQKTYSYSLYGKIEEDKLTPEQVLEIIQGKDRLTSHWFEDHPEFIKLRYKLEELGFVKLQHNWLNGDTVIKPFILNDIKYKKHDRFLSAAALRLAIDVAKKSNKKYVPSR